MTAIYTGLNFFGIKLRSFKVMNLAICFGIVLFSNVAFAQSSKPLDSITTVITAVENSQDFNNLSHDYIDLLTIAAEESRHSKIDRLHFYAAKALKLSEQIGYIKGEINSLLVMGYYHAYNGNFEKSSENQLRAYEMAVASKNQDLEIKASYWIGRDLKDRSQYGEALEYLYHAIDLSTIADDKFHLSRSKGIIAHMYRMNHNYEESLIIYKEILAINEQHGDDFLSNVSRANLSILYGKMGETEKALEYIDAAMNYAKEINHKHFIAFTYGAKGGIYEDAKNPKLALEWYEISKNSLNGIDDNRNMAAFLTGMALAHFQLDNSNEAEALALESLKLAEPLNLPSIVEKNYELLYRIYSAQNKADKALGYHVAFKKIADSTSRQMNSNGLEILKAKMEFDKQKESDKLVSDLELSKQKRFTYLGILSVLILAFIIYLLISRSRVRQKLLHELKQSNQTKDKLFSVIGHDLKNPIMSLQQLLTLWINKDLSDTQLVKYIPKLSTRVDAISFMLNNLLSWGSAQIEGGEKEFQKIELRELVVENIKFATTTIAKKDIKVFNEVSSSYILIADRVQIDVVLRNLLNNALKFTPNEGAIIIRASEEPNYWKILVKDNGVGIPPEVLQSLFEKTDTTTSSLGTNNEPGTGIGLVLCKEMVENHGGTIGADSGPNQGSTFYFTIPKLKVA